MLIDMTNRGRIADPAVEEEFDTLTRRIRTGFSALLDADGEPLVPADETGRWLPTVGGNATYTARTGSYVRKGQWVQVHGMVWVATLGTGSTGVITGLPFPPETHSFMVYAGLVGYFAGAASNFMSVSIYAQSPYYAPSTGGAIVVTGLTAAAATPVNPAVFFGNNARIDFTIAYPIEAGA